LGTAASLKQRFATRPLVEINTTDPVATMETLDRLPQVEKTSLFGTAVHAVLRERTTDIQAVNDALVHSGQHITSISTVAPSLEDVFLDVVEEMEDARA
jgi:hypothetical protein